MKNELVWAAMGFSSLASGAVDTGTDTSGTSSRKVQTQAVPATVKAPDLENLLKRVATDQAPKELSLGAMCYKVAMPPDRVEYVCPSCGTKTLYATTEAGAFVGEAAPALEIQTYRTYVHRLAQFGLDIRFDESCLCSACKKESAKAPAIEVLYKGKKTRNDLHDVNDLRKLLAFVEGKLVWEDSHAGEHPLKPEIPRICEWLGIKP